MDRKRNLVLALLVAVVVAGLATWWARFRVETPPQTGGVAEPAPVVHLGADLPLSGDMSFYGQEVQRGLQLALQGVKSIRVLYEDNHSNARDSVTVFQKFASRGDVPVVISSNSPLGAPLRSLAQQNETVLLALVTGAKDFAAGNPWVFRDSITQAAQGPPLAQYAVEEVGASRAATLVVNDDYGLDGATAFESAFEAMGGDVVASETFETPDTDMRSQLTKLKRSSPEVLFVVGREQNLIAAVVQAVELDVAPVILSVNAFDSETVIRGTGTAGERVVFTSYDVDLDAREDSRRFKERFLAAYDDEPSIYAIDAYAAGHYLQEIVEEHGGDAQAIRHALVTLATPSIKGPIEVTKEGDIVPPIGLFTIKGGLKTPLSRGKPVADAA